MATIYSCYCTKSFE